LSRLLALFLDNLLPVFLVAGAGYFLARFLKTPSRPLSQAVFYIFSPCLIFSLITGSTLDGVEIARLVFFTLVIGLILGVLAWLVGMLFRFERKILAAVILTSILKNAGNFGLAVTLFAFGEKALPYASIFFITNALLSYSAGALIASLGSESLGRSLRNLLLVPGLYAVLLGLVVVSTGWLIPSPLERAIHLLGDASIPAMLVLLGMQLQGVEWKGNTKPLMAATVLSLVAAPLVALLVSGFFRFENPARQAVVLEASMPSAVMNIVLATEYNLHPTFVTSVVLITTLLSPLTLTPLMAILGG
jgi:malate permease and related proteins